MRRSQPWLPAIRLLLRLRPEVYRRRRSNPALLRLQVYRRTDATPCRTPNGAGRRPLGLSEATAGDLLELRHSCQVVALPRVSRPIDFATRPAPLGFARSGTSRGGCRRRPICTPPGSRSTSWLRSPRMRRRRSAPETRSMLPGGVACGWTTGGDQGRGTQSPPRRVPGGWHGRGEGKGRGAACGRPRRN
jgi:hypothetical protein